MYMYTVASVLWANAGLVSAQTLYLPSFDAPHSLLSQWTRSEPRGYHLDFTASATAETNVQPVLADFPPPFHASRAYFSSSQLYQVSFETKRWRISYAYGEANLYRGNNGAARLYREAQQGALDPASRYTVHATLNRTAVNALSIAHLWEKPTVQLTLTAHWLLLRRVQYGTLYGEKEGERFTGTLTLQTTRGIAAHAIDGQGLAVDATLLLRPSRRWYIGLKAENLLSWLRIGTIQQVEARVLVNRPEPDPDGFLHAPPVLEGRTTTCSLRAQATVYCHGVIAYQHSPMSWALMFTHDFSWRTGIAVAHAGSMEWWCILWLERPEWQLGFRYAGWEITAGFDHPNWGLAKRLTMRVRWSLRL